MIISREVLRALVETLTGVETILDPMFPRTVVSPTTKGQIFLNIKATRPLGVDDFIPVFNKVQAKNEITQAQNILFTASVKMESFDRDTPAYEILERLRSRIFWRSSLDTLRAANMTVTQAGATVDLPTTYDDHVYSVAALDFEMAARPSQLTDDDGNWIETVSASGEPELESIVLEIDGTP